MLRKKGPPTASGPDPSHEMDAARKLGMWGLLEVAILAVGMCTGSSGTCIPRTQLHAGCLPGTKNMQAVAHTPGAFTAEPPALQGVAWELAQLRPVWEVSSRLQLDRDCRDP